MLESQVVEYWPLTYISPSDNGNFSTAFVFDLLTFLTNKKKLFSKLFISWLFKEEIISFLWFTRCSVSAIFCKLSIVQKKKKKKKLV